MAISPYKNREDTIETYKRRMGWIWFDLFSQSRYMNEYRQRDRRHKSHLPKVFQLLLIFSSHIVKTLLTESVCLGKIFWTRIVPSYFFNTMTHLFWTRIVPSSVSLMTIAIAIFSSVELFTIAPASAKLFDSPVDRLPTLQRVTLRKGQSLVTGEKGNYTARILVSASPEVVWKVLTDYENLPKFLPNVISNKVLSNNGDRKIVEQVNSRQVLFIKVKSRIRTAIAETRQNRIDFQQIDGDLQQMQGYWLIEPVAPYKGAKADRVLITQIIEAQPKEGTPKDIFYDIFQNSLGETLNAIAKEINRRTTNSAAN